MTNPEAAKETETNQNKERTEDAPLSATLLSGMAAAAGLDLSTERAAQLATQAAPHFALLRTLGNIPHPSTEPAAEFHLDSWRGADHG